MNSISFQNNSLLVPDTPVIPFIEGDGIGKEISVSVRKVIDCAVKSAYGNKKKIELLKGVAINGNIPHAMLFSGPEKIGKKKIALEFINTIFCKDLCGECSFCKSMNCNPDINIIPVAINNIFLYILLIFWRIFFI